MIAILVFAALTVFFICLAALCTSEAKGLRVALAARWKNLTEKPPARATECFTMGDYRVVELEGVQWYTRTHEVRVFRDLWRTSKAVGEYTEFTIEHKATGWHDVEGYPATDEVADRLDEAWAAHRRAEDIETGLQKAKASPEPKTPRSS